MKFFVIIMSLLSATALGYLGVYHLTVNSFLEELQIYKGQLVESSNIESIRKQLKDLGRETKSLQSLDVPSSTQYRADVLEGYEIKKQQNPPQEKGYYFYDHGRAYFLRAKESEPIQEKDIIPLFSE